MCGGFPFDELKEFLEVVKLSSAIVTRFGRTPDDLGVELRLRRSIQDQQVCERGRGGNGISDGESSGKIQGADV